MNLILWRKERGTCLGESGLLSASAGGSRNHTPFSLLMNPSFSFDGTMLFSVFFSFLDVGYYVCTSTASSHCRESKLLEIPHELNTLCPMFVIDKICWMKWTQVGVGGRREAAECGMPSLWKPSEMAPLNPLHWRHVQGNFRQREMVISANLLFGLEFISTENIIGLKTSCFPWGFSRVWKLKSNKLCFLCWFFGTFLKCLRNDESANYKVVVFRPCP